MAPDSLLPLADAALRGIAFALLALLAATLWRDLRRTALARAGVALALGLCVQLVGSAPAFEAGVHYAWQAPLVAVSVGNAVLFWAFVQALFDDEFAFGRVHALAWAGVAALSAFNCLVGPFHGSVLVPLLRALQQAVPLVFAALAARAALRRWHADLLESRRRLRGFILVAGVAYTVLQVAARVSSPFGRLPQWVALGDVAALLAIAAVVAWRLLRVGPSELFAPAVPEVVPAARQAPGEVPALPDPAEDRLVESLARLMRDERPYRDEDLSVAGLAARLSVPEYRLRRAINQRLGHRNFNAYVNGFRLADAQAALADGAQRDQPVLSIALEAGFQSIGPFNRAFKAATGLTPTEYRREKLADS